ncbi:MAG: hypothetical protein H7070_09850 [Saprospiraceae bacterium]|nr:hypothetical protein [Pyrinomonadaceae bacterium]
MNYVTEIADFFVCRFPGIAILSPADYTIIAEWEKEEIPVEIVRRTIDEVFPDHNDENFQPELVKCHEKVKINFRQWLADGKNKA